MAGTWTAVTVADRPAAAFHPQGPRPPAHGLLFLQTFGQADLAQLPTLGAVLTELNLACLAPLDPHNFWIDRALPGRPGPTGEGYLLAEVLPWLEREWQLAPPRIGLLGFSLGGGAALRLAFKHPKRFPAVASLAGVVDLQELYGQGTDLDTLYDSKEQCRQDTAPMHVHPQDYPPHVFFAVDPTDWPWFRGNDRLHEKLRALGIVHTCDLATAAGGHTAAYLDALADRAVRFVHGGLVAEGRRLL